MSDATSDDGEDEIKKKGPTQASLIVELARAAADLFHDGEHPYLHVRAGDHRETHRLRSTTGRAWFIGLFFDAMQQAPGAQGLSDAIGTLEAVALRGADVPVSVRLAAAHSTICLDLGDASWRAVEVNAGGWRIVQDASLRFRRPKGLQPLPVPQPGGQIGALRRFVNLSGDEDFVLLVAVLVAWLRGRGPYPVLVLNGEQGSAKSTLTRVVKSLIDPNMAPLRSAPREPRDLMIAAVNSHVLGFDNLSDLPAWLSDGLCRLSTGGGFSTRTLYSDDEEMIFDAVRPVILNGIPEFASRQDLVGRSVFLTLPVIRDGQRRAERTFWADFEQARPSILGALLDIAAVAWRNEASVSLPSQPRMADFARWSVAAESACPWPSGTFLSVYAGNRASAVEATLDGDPVADVVKTLGTWSGTARDLLSVLNEKTAETLRNTKDWFKQCRRQQRLRPMGGG